MASGDEMLDASGNEILDASGNRQLSDGAGDACCCCPTKCFQTWIATWTCSTQSWSGPVTDNRLCLAADTDTSWVQTSSSSTTCTYRKYVPYSPVQCCSVNGDCTSGLGDTATPSLPFSGGTPTDCPCLAPTPCGYCTGNTPKIWTVTFSGVGNASFFCAGECSFGGQVGGTGTLGTYTLVQDTSPGAGCKWIYDGTGPSVKNYYDTADCSGAYNEYNTLHIEIVMNGDGSLRLYALMRDADNNPISADLKWFDNTTDAMADCCANQSFTNDYTAYSCGFVGKDGTAVATPSC